MKLTKVLANKVFKSISALSAAVRYVDADANLDCANCANPEMIRATGGQGVITVYNGRGHRVGRLEFNLHQATASIDVADVRAIGWQSVRERGHYLLALASCAESIEAIAGGK